MSDVLRIMLTDEAATRALGRALAELAPPRLTIALDGTLGAGKTRLVQGIAEAAGIDPDAVLSPTYTLIHEYPLERPGRTATLYHLDAYRLRDAEEFWELGVEELFASQAWVVVEWAARVEPCLPAERLDIVLEIVGATARRALLTPRGPDAVRVTRGLSARGYGE